jgi:hypothetical protein
MSMWRTVFGRLDALFGEYNAFYSRENGELRFRNFIDTKVWPEPMQVIPAQQSARRYPSYLRLVGS